MRFREKPDEATAKDYFDSGQYAWNSGMFVWRCETILNNLKKFLPECVEPLNAIQLDWGGPDQQQTLQESGFRSCRKLALTLLSWKKTDKVLRD